MNTRMPARLLAAGAAAGMLMIAAPASAHVTVTPSTTAAGAFTVLTVALGHGCEESPTTKVAVEVPEPILSVTPTRHPMWNVEVQTEKLPEPLEDAHGNEVTERDAVVVYTAKTPLPDGIRDSFEISVQLPDTPGETLLFPAIQTCEKGHTNWTEVPAEGQSADELEHPAPAVEVTEAEDDGHSTESADATEDDEEQEDEDASDALGIAGLGVGGLGLVVGGTALAKVRRRE